MRHRPIGIGVQACPQPSTPMCQPPNPKGVRQSPCAASASATVPCPDL
jgi:hypothetical protein